MTFSFARVGALCLRYLYLLSSSWPRLLELVYWPILNLMTWGFLQTYAMNTSNSALFAAGALVSGLLLWEVLFRGQLGFSISFLEEIWSRNLGNLLMSPLRPIEFVAALMVMSLLRLMVGLLPTVVLAIAFFGFDLARLGIGLVAFFALLIITGWAVALLVAGLILRHGLGAESLAWTILFVFWPLCCVYYPLAVLPWWLKPIALALPPTYVFEGMRTVLAEGVLRLDYLAAAAILNMIWFAVASWGFVFLLNKARAAGALLSSGE
ncbi:ABC transporter permease [Phreatobacter stygius]|uniref:Transport permease protein n=1 Tax=Phreatobacter stygius TaxID=1940610 RepID=A0A4D7B1V2_9HYPH|nr:ABC transporter permease [Phreatobacter stygius]QCI64973.1 ABC transporter permease [Phreatobacter stygius]